MSLFKEVGVCVSFPSFSSPLQTVPLPSSQFWAPSREQLDLSDFPDCSVRPSTYLLSERIAPYMDRIKNHPGVQNRVSVGC